MAEANGIPYEPRECTYEGDCTGTCPFCEKEAEELLAELKKKEAEGAEIKTDLFSIEVMEEEIRHLLTSSSCHPEILIEQECDFLMTFH